MCEGALSKRLSQILKKSLAILAILIRRSGIVGAHPKRWRGSVRPKVLWGGRSERLGRGWEWKSCLNVATLPQFFKQRVTMLVVVASGPDVVIAVALPRWFWKVGRWRGTEEAGEILLGLHLIKRLLEHRFLSR